MSLILQLSEFVWALSSSVWVVFNHFLLRDATDRSKISRDHHQILFIFRVLALPQTQIFFSYIFANQTMKNVISNNLSLKYESFTPLRCKDLGTWSFAKTQFLLIFFNFYSIFISWRRKLQGREKYIFEIVPFIVGLFKPI